MDPIQSFNEFENVRKVQAFDTTNIAPVEQSGIASAINDAWGYAKEHKVEVGVAAAGAIAGTVALAYLKPWKYLAPMVGSNTEAATAKLVASGIPITAESRAAAMLGLNRSLAGDVEALVTRSIPINPETRAAAAAGLNRIAPATDALIKSGIPITAETRAAMAAGRSVTPATDALIRSGIPITAENRARMAASAATEDLLRAGIPINPATRRAAMGLAKHIGHH